MDPPDNAVILSVDEKTQIQALDRTQPGLPLNPSRIGSRTHDYKRNSTASSYAAFTTLTGKVIGKVAERANSKEFLAFLKLSNRRTPSDRQLHIILDNLSAHEAQAVQIDQACQSHFGSGKSCKGCVTELTAWTTSAPAT